MEGLEEGGDVDVDHIGASVAKDIHERRVTPLVHPSQQPPPRSCLRAVLLCLLRYAGAQRQHHHLVAVQRLHLHVFRISGQYSVGDLGYCY